MLRIRILFIISLLVFLSIACSEETAYLEVPETSEQYPWGTSSPELEGLNQTLIDSAFILAEEQSYMRSILVIKNGKIVAEKYFRYFKQNSWHDLRSATKSFTSAITGIAIDKGLLRLNDKIADILPYGITQNADYRIHKVTIEQLLQMKSGIGSDDFFATYNSDIVYPNILQFIMNTPMQAYPGTTFLYSSNANFLLTAAIKEVSGKSAKEFAEEYLCKPLGISISAWSSDTKGINYGGGGLYLSTRNMAAFGLLYLKNGYVNGQQLISQDWIAISFSDHLHAQTDWSVVKNIGYGYLWWMGKLNEYSIYYAMGYAGQFIIIIPESDMIICTTAKAQVSTTQAGIQEDFIMKLVQEYLLPKESS